MAPEDAKHYGIIDAVNSEKQDTLTAQHHDEKVAEATEASEDEKPQEPKRSKSEPAGEGARTGSRDLDQRQQGTQGPVSLLLLRQEPGAGSQAHRGSGC